MKNNLLVVEQIKTRYLNILDEINSAKKRAVNQGVQVIVVTKRQPINIVRLAIAAGVDKFGENYAEEAVAKINAFDDRNIEWHMIGHIQRRKVNVVGNNFHMVHSVDSIQLSERLNSCCRQINRKLPVLVEVNVSGEVTKNGFPAWDESKWEALVKVFEEINKSSNLIIRGLMTMPPLFLKKELSRPYFVKTRKLRDYLTSALPKIDWSELSMGTSNDYQVAVEEGATYVRIGEAILGKRKSEEN